VERSQQTDWVEFYATADLADPDLALRLEEWQFFYNWRRPHTSLNGLTPMERYCALSSQTPYTEEIHAQYALTPERYQERNYYLDRQLRGLKRSL
jgi:putative transposase